MVPLIALLISFAVLRLAGFTGIAWLDNWGLPLRIALFLMFMLTASAHWGRGRADLIRMVPRAFPAPEAIITLTGVLEVLGGVGLLIPQTAHVAAVCLAILLIAMFPANIRAARERFTIRGRTAMSVAARGAIQAIFVGSLVTVAVLQ
jgi:uncharacterized membrane protein